VRIVDEAKNRTLLRMLRKKREATAERDKSLRALKLVTADAEGASQGVRLLRGEAVDETQGRPEQLMQPGERQVRLRLDAARRKNEHVGRPVACIVEQRRLAHSRLTEEDESAAVRRAACLEERVDLRQLHVAPDEHRPCYPRREQRPRRIPAVSPMRPNVSPPRVAAPQSLEKEIAMQTATPPSSTNADPVRIDGFPVGYYDDLHPDVSLNYQMNRFSTGEQDMINEIRAVAPKIHDYGDYTREFLRLGKSAVARGDHLEGALYLRSAEFYMFADDPKKQPTRRRYLQLVRQHYGLADSRFEVPYETGALSAFRPVPPQDPKGTIVLFCGFDSYIEELFPMQLYFREAGYDVVSFDGPGQGVPLEDGLMPMTPDWHKPVSALLDFFDLDDVTLIGCSLGGCLAVRAAAYEPRVTRVVANDILTDFFEATLGQMKQSTRTELSALLETGADHVVDKLVERVMKGSLVIDWGVRQGMHVTGTGTPSGFFREIQRYRTDDISPLIEQDVLLLAGDHDHYVPLHQLDDQIRTLTQARSVTARVFTREEQAHEHIQVGNYGLQYRVIKDWIELTQAKERVMQAQTALRP
jgi:pimeloyl-ACP methyl ester carboxylesterase